MEKQEFVLIGKGFEQGYQFGKGHQECELVSGLLYFRALSLLLPLAILRSLLLPLL